MLFSKLVSDADALQGLKMYDGIERTAGIYQHDNDDIAEKLCNTVTTLEHGRG